MRGIRSERGVSLVELLVSMFLVVILGVVISGLFITATKSVAIGSAMNTGTGTTANAMNEISRAIRSGTTTQVGGVVVPAVGVAQPETLVIYSYVDTDELTMRPIKIQFAVDATSRQIVETRWLAKDAGSGTWKFDVPLTVLSTKTIPGIVILKSAAYPSDLFTYLRADNTTIANTAAGLSITDLATVVAIKVKISERPSTTSTAVPVIISNEVGMPNLGTARTGNPQP